VVEDDVSQLPLGARSAATEIKQTPGRSATKAPYTEPI